jgi:hypothetical protein
MSGLRARAVVALGTALLLVAACGKQESPPAQDPAAERAAATERAKQGPFGADVKALEKAKGMGADLNKKAEDNLEKADK